MPFFKAKFKKSQTTDSVSDSAKQCLLHEGGGASQGKDRTRQ